MTARGYVMYAALGCGILTSLIVGAGEKVGLNLGDWGFTIMAIPVITFAYELLRAWWKLDGDKSWSQPKVSDRSLLIFCYFSFYAALPMVAVLTQPDNNKGWLGVLLVSSQPLILQILRRCGLM